jgi:hypothetical protein
LAVRSYFKIEYRQHQGEQKKADIAKIIEDFRVSATQGYVHAQFMLGFLFERGYGKGLSESAVWYWRAAEQGHLDAMFNLSKVLKLIDADRAESEKWGMEAASRGHPAAQFTVGTSFAEKQRHSEAVFWFRKAASQGYSRAQLNLGRAYYYGQGAPLSLPEAVRWYRKAAKLGLDKAQVCLPSSSWAPALERVTRLLRMSL